MRETAEHYVAAIAARDHDGIAGSLSPGAHMRYLIPPGPAELTGAEEVAATFLRWFGGAELIEVQDVRVESLADRTSARYRIRLREQGVWRLAEQQQYLDLDEEGRIESIDLLCSGFRSVGDAEAAGRSGTHQFDAGTRGCADGLAQEFRKRIEGIPIGDVLEVQTTDPAAKEEIAPLARMMGHTVRSVEPSDNGRLLITVERGR